MQNVFIRLLKAYKRHDFLVRTGLNPYYFAEADAPFARLFAPGNRPVGVGAGIAPQEIEILELLLGTVKPKNILIIGNAFGWSSIAVAMSAPGARVVAMEAGLEGDSTDTGTELTHAIAAEEQLDVRVVHALSPRDTADVVGRAFAGQPLDFVLIDGLHVNEQLSRDIEGVLPHAAPHCVFFLHDVLSWHMLGAFEGASFGAGRERRLLTRCPSGPGVVFPSTLGQDAREIIDAFIDDTVDIAAMHAELGATAERPGGRLEGRLARGWRHRRVGLAETYAVEGRTSLEREELERAASERPDDAAAQYEVGVHHADRARWEEAERALRKAVALSPEWALPVQQLGRVLRELGSHEEARHQLERAAAIAPTWAAPPFELGLLAEKLGAFDEAYRFIGRACDLDPEWPLPYEACGRVAYALGVEYADQKRWAEAEQLLREAVARRPDWASPLQQLGRVLRERGAFAEARQYLDQAVALEPAWAAPYFELGHIALAIQLPADAYRWFRKAMDLAPEWMLACLECARSAFAEGEFAVAIAALRKVLESGVVTHGVPHLLALATERLEGPTAAAPIFLLAVAVAPHSAEAQFDAARVHAARGDEQLALQHFVTAGELRADWDAPWVEAFALASRLGRVAESERSVARLAALGIDSVEHWLAIANIGANGGDGDAARSAVQRALALRNEPMEPLKALAVRVLERGDAITASGLCGDLLERFPEWAGVHYLHGQALEELVRLDEARSAYERAAALRPAWADAQQALVRVAAAAAVRKAS